MTSYIVTLEEDEEGNLLLPLPKELFEGEYPWMPDDEVVWSVNEDGTTIITNTSWLIRNENGFG